MDVGMKLYVWWVHRAHAVCLGVGDVRCLMIYTIVDRIVSLRFVDGDSAELVACTGRRCLDKGKAIMNETIGNSRPKKVPSGKD